MSRFVTVDRDTAYLLPPSVDEWLPPGHLARYIVEVVEALFVQVLRIARENRRLKVGHIALDGTTVKANASRHSALSYGHIRQLEAQLGAEVAALLKQAEAADSEAPAAGLDIAAERARREERLARIAEAKAKIEARAAERHAAEQAEYEAKRAAYEQRRKRGGGGSPPSPPSGGIEDKAQINLTDEDSRIRPVAGGGFEQCYNAQLGVDIDSRLIVLTDITQSSVDKPQVAPALAKLASLAEALEQRPQSLIADNGFMSTANVAACAEQSIEPLFALGREKHHLSLDERFAPEPNGPESDDPLTAMAHRLKTRAGKALYALRKSTVEPVIGILKSVMGFDHFSLRGLDAVSAEWNLAGLAYHVKRRHCLQRA